MALGLPKKQKEPYSKDGQNGHNSNLQQGRRQTLEIDFIVEREDFDGGEDSGGVKLAHILPGPAAASKSGSSGCKKVRNNIALVIQIYVFAISVAARIWRSELHKWPSREGQGSWRTSKGVFV